MEIMGHTVDVLMPDDDDLPSYDIVHVHMHNQAHIIHNQNVDYVFTVHDIHALLEDKGDLFNSHVEAIRNSLVTIVPGEFAVDHFKDVSHKIRVLRHGVNSDFFQDTKNNIDANGDGTIDRHDNGVLVNGIKVDNRIDRTNPRKKDTDSDDLPDGWEYEFGRTKIRKFISWHDKEFGTNWVSTINQKHGF